MERAYYRTLVGERQVRHRVVLTDTWVCTKNSPVGRRRQRELLMEFAQASHLHETGPVIFDECRIKHDGQHWTIELEGTENVPSP